MTRSPKSTTALAAALSAWPHVLGLKGMRNATRWLRSVEMRCIVLKRKTTNALHCNVAGARFPARCEVAWGPAGGLWPHSTLSGPTSCTGRSSSSPIGPALGVAASTRTLRGFDTMDVRSVCGRAFENAGNKFGIERVDRATCRLSRTSVWIPHMSDLG